MAGTIDFAIAFLVLLVLMVYYEVRPTASLLLLPVFLCLLATTALGVAFWLSALNVQYRDVRHMVPFLVQFWLFATPIAYPSSLLTEPWRTVYGLNPMVGVVEGFRWALLGTSPPLLMICVSAVVSVALLFSGLHFFGRMERRFADII
jgi:lipopolysaccharide transport system permease protein